MEATPRRSSLSARVNSLEDVVEELSGALEAQLAHAAIYAEVEESLLAREQALLAREAIAADEDEAFDKALRSRCCGFSFFYHPGTPVQLPWIFPAALAGLAAAYALIVTSPTPANAAAARAAAAAAAKALAEAQSARSVFVATVLRILSLFTSLAVADEVDIPYIGIIECGQDLRATAGWGVLGLSVGVILATLYILPPMQKLSRSYRAHINPSLPPLPSEASSLDHADPAAVAAAAAGKSPSVANLSLQLPLPEGSQGIKALAREAEAAPLATPISQKFAALSPRTFAAASAVKPRPAPISPLTASPAHSHSAPLASPFRLATSPVAAIARPPGSAVRLTPAAARWLLQQAGNPVDWDLPSRGRARASDDDYDDDEDEEYDEQQQQRGVRGSGSGSVRKQRVHVQLPEPSPAAATDNASDKVHTDKDDLHDATRELMYADYFGSPPAPVTTDADTPSSDVVSPVLPAAGPATGSSVGVDNEALADVSLAVSSAAGGAGDDDIVSFGRMIDHTFSASAPAQAQAQAQVSASTSVLGRIINRVRGSKGTKKATRKRKSKADQTMEEAHIAAMLASAPKTVDDSWAHDDAAGYSSHSSSPASSDVDDEDEDEDYDDDEKVQSQYADLDEDDPVARAAAAAVAAASGPLTAEEEAYVAEIDSSRVLAALAAASPVRAPAVKTPASVKKAPAPVSAAVLAAAAAEAEAADISAAADVAAAAAVASDSEEVEWPKAPEGVRASLESALAAAAVETPLPEPATEAAGVEAALESAEDAAIAALITRTDALAASRDYSTLYSHLTPPSAAPGIAEYVSGSAELLWRRARACYHTAKAFAAAGDTDAQRARVAAGAADAAAAVAVDDQSAMAHKWVAILSNEVGRLGGQQEKIAQAFVFQEHTRKAIALSPNDPDLQHMLGRFCLEISSVSWAVRRIASVAFGGLPNATVDEALVHFQAAARGEPAWPLNMAWMGKALAKLGRGDEARDVLKQALAMPVQRAEDEEAHELAKKELAAL